MQKEPLGCYWKRKTELNSPNTDRLLKYSDRIRGDVQRAIQCGQQQIVAFSCLSTKSSQRELYKEIFTGARDPLLWFELPTNTANTANTAKGGKDSKESCKDSKESFGNSSKSPREEKSPRKSPRTQWDDDDNEGIKGYRLDERFLPLLRWIKEEGLDFALDVDNLNLVVYWNFHTARTTKASEALSHVFIQSMAVPMQKDPEGIARIRARIRSAMDAGQTRSLLCLLYKNQDYMQKRHDTIIDTRYCCTPDHDWILQKRIHFLVDLVEEDEKLNWDLEFDKDVEQDEHAFMYAYW